MKRKRLTKPRHQQNKNVLKNYLEESRVTSSTPAQLDCTPTILSVLLYMKKEGYSQATLRFVSKALKFLNAPCNLDDPESVKEFVADYNSANSYKRNICHAYNHYLEFKGLELNCPKYSACDPHSETIRETLGCWASTIRSWNACPHHWRGSVLRITIDYLIDSLLT
jgi:hypothetical protein